MGKYLKFLGILEFIGVGIYFIVLAIGGFEMASLLSSSSGSGAGAGLVIVFILIYLLFAPAPGALLYAVGAIYDNTRK